MTARRIGISEARRLLPQLVKTVAREGGRVDITYRGQTRVSLLRTSDIRAPRGRHEQDQLAAALRVELAVDPDRIPALVHDLRARVGQPRRDWLGGDGVASRKPKSSRARRRSG